VLNKPGKLTDEEFDLIKTHTTLGHQILAKSQRPILKTAALVALQHHERWDGNGYPQGLAGEDIHIYGRIVAIIDVFDALTSNRCYRPAMSLAEALAVMTEGRGSQFDAELFDLFLTNLDQFVDLREAISLGQALAAPTPAPATPAPEPEAEVVLS